MDHIGILKRAWRITWRYRALWILGLFAGAGGGSGGGSGSRGYDFGSGGRGGGSFPGSDFMNSDQISRWFEQNLPLIVLAAALLFLLGIVWWILSVAARGGLVWLANEAAEERTVKAGDGWGAGFHFWGRTFLISFLLALPLLLIAIVIAVVFAGTIVSIIAAGSGAAGGDAVAAGGALGLCGFLGLALIVIIPLAILIGLLTELALRHGVLDDMGAVDAIKAAWQDVRHRFKDVVVMWLLMAVVGFVYGIVVGIAALIFVLPAVGFAVARMYAVAAVLFVVMVLALLVPGAIYGAYFSTAWTLFFRRLTGREAVEQPRPAYGGGYPQAPGAYPPPTAPGVYPPPPPPPPAPPAYPPPPPAPPAPPETP